MEKDFTVGLSKEEEMPYIQQFLQDIEVLLQSTEREQQSTLISILIQLSMIKFKNFGLECFNIIIDVMLSGDVMFNVVYEQVQNDVVKHMEKMSNIFNLSITTFKGITKLLKETEKCELVHELILLQVPKWLG